MKPTPLSIYIHIPFCRHRCAYCDFNTFAGVDHLIPDFVTALRSEIAQTLIAGVKPAPRTIFFGGGTPSLISPKQYEEIFKSLSDVFSFSDLSEVSLEVNPGTILPNYFHDLHSIGFNRVSVGVQSANPSTLKFLERIHTFDEVKRTVDEIRAAGIDNLNLDLIYAIPGQTMTDWRSDLEQILQLAPPHVSLYSLGIEEGTPLGKWYRKGLIEVQDDDLSADEYQHSREILAESGYTHYEISNWAKPNRECEHNKAYWKAYDYLAFGPGAHGHFQGRRYSVIRGLRKYIQAMNEHGRFEGTWPLTNAVDETQNLTPKQQLQDALMVGFRLLREGVDLAGLAARYGVDPRIEFAKSFSKLYKLGLIEDVGDWTRLTERAYFIGNQVFSEFMD